MNVKSKQANPDPLRRNILQGMAATVLLPWTSMARSSPSRPPVVETAYGRVRGQLDGNTNVFKGIRYGADTATTRFRRPAPPLPWAGIRDALDYGARCPQLPRRDSAPRKLLQSWTIPQAESEDCLFLNVWTPAPRDSTKRPVMVWIHGGGFASGSGAAMAYEGNRLAEKGDVVVVTVNHRLNVFGYLYLGDMSDELADSGNAGQHDLIASLRWIRDNIAEFGGDPDNVTIFGESGGGAKVSTLLAMEEAAGLFHRAVIQSGPMLWAAEADAAMETGHLGMAALGASRGELGRLDTASTGDVMQALLEIVSKGRFRTLAPAIDGRGLTRHPFEPDAPAVSARVPVMIGYTATETTFLLGFDDALFKLDWSSLPDRLAAFVGDADPHVIVRRYRDAFPEFSASRVFFDVTSMQMISRNSLRIAKHRAEQAGAGAYVYELAYATDIDGGKWRSPHTLDIPLVFDNVQKSRSMFGDTARAQEVADDMSSAWLAFATSGTPGGAAWPKWDETARQAMVFDVDSAVVTGLRAKRSEILREIPYFDITRPNDL